MALAPADPSSSLFSLFWPGPISTEEPRVTPKQELEESLSAGILVAFGVWLLKIPHLPAGDLFVSAVFPCASSVFLPEACPLPLLRPGPNLSHLHSSTPSLGSCFSSLPRTSRPLYCHCWRLSTLCFLLLRIALSCGSWSRRLS